MNGIGIECKLGSFFVAKSPLEKGLVIFHFSFYWNDRGNFSEDTNEYRCGFKKAKGVGVNLKNFCPSKCFQSLSRSVKSGRREAFRFFS